MATLNLKNNSKVIQKIAQLQASARHQYVDLCKQNGLNYAFDNDGGLLDDATDTEYPFVPLSDEQYAIYSKLNDTFETTYKQTGDEAHDKASSDVSKWMWDTFHKNAVDFGLVKDEKDIFIDGGVYGVYKIDA